MLGIVQGVGFRPFVARLAGEFGLTGFVRNTTSAVIIEVEGSAAAIEAFASRLQRDAPPASTIEHVEREEIAPLEETAFRIVESGNTGDFGVGLPPDLAMCADCRRELEDPSDRRYKYPFLNCTACGPRYSIVESLPYDRPRTTMRSFPMCADCEAEYHDAANRRYHAQPIACPVCGPRVRFEPDDGLGLDAMERALNALSAGKIVAIRGLGGFHLACDARDVATVETLRRRKARGSQPFALMVRNLATAREFAVLNGQSEAILHSPASPIVLLPKAGETQVGETLAPGNGFLGIMLPYTPLHHLLLNGRLELNALVMTSGNRHGEPIASSNEAALQDLAELADAFLLHNRDIFAFCDDSVVRLYQGRPLAIRRSRGYSPLKVKMPVASQPALAAGADLKCALGLAEGTRAYVSPHIGDMENVPTLEAFEKVFRHLSDLHNIRPKLVIHDAHPGYLSTQWAKRFAKDNGLPSYAVQHHRAHAASVMAEYGVSPETRIVAAVFDGTGYGDDGAIWGGEFFCGAVGQLERCLHLPYVSLPGGDTSAKRPSVCAFAHLVAAGLGDSETVLTVNERKIIRQQIEKNVNCHATSSMGRLFDAAVSMLGIRQQIEYEAQAAIEMEALAAKHEHNDSYHASNWVLKELWEELFADGRSSVAARGRRFIGTISRWTCETLQKLAGDEKTETIVLGGGVFQNILLLESVVGEMESHGLKVLVPRYLPPNDGGLALGQLYMAAILAQVNSLNAANP